MALHFLVIVSPHIVVVRRERSKEQVQAESADANQAITS